MTVTRTVVNATEWAKRKEELLQEEKELTEKQEALMAKVRALPWTKVAKQYTFQTSEGIKTLAELFDGRSQLVIYHFMMGPGTKAVCEGCSFSADHFDGLHYHLPRRDVTFKVISRAPLEAILAYKARMGWRFDWVSSSGTDYNADMGLVIEGDKDEPAVCVYCLEGGEVYQTYFSVAGSELRCLTDQILKVVPKGGSVFEGEWWVKRHDEY